MSATRRGVRRRTNAPRPRRLGACLLPFGLFGAVANARAADPTTQDCLSANERSIALRRELKLRAARSELLVCAASSCPADVRRECTRRVEEVNRAIPTIVFEAEDASGADVSSVRVSMDGQPLAERLEGTAMSVDPGSHTFRFEAGGAPAVERDFVIHEGEKERHERIVIAISQPGVAPSATLARAPAVVAGAASTAPSTDASAGGTRRRSSSLAVAGLVVTGAGVVGLGAGAVLGFSAKSRYDESNQNGHCAASGCDDVGLRARHDAFGMAGVSTGLVVAGAVLAAGGLTLYLVDRAHSAPAGAALTVVPLPGRAGLGATLRGEF